MKREIKSEEINLKSFCKALYREYSKPQNGRARLKHCAPIFKNHEGIWAIELRKHDSNDLFDIRIETKEIDLEVLMEIERGVEAYLKGNYENAD